MGPDRERLTGVVDLDETMLGGVTTGDGGSGGTTVVLIAVERNGRQLGVQSRAAAPAPAGTGTGCWASGWTASIGVVGPIAPAARGTKPGWGRVNLQLLHTTSRLTRRPYGPTAAVRFVARPGRPFLADDRFDPATAP